MADLPPPPTYDFYARLARTINSGLSRAILLTGNIHDLFHAGQFRATTGVTVGESEGESITGADAAGFDEGYVTLTAFLTRRAAVPGLLTLVYELNGPLRLLPGHRWDDLRGAWVAWRSGVGTDDLVLQSLSDQTARSRREQLASEFDGHVHEANGKPTIALELLRQLALCSRGRDESGRPFLKERLLILIEAADLLLPTGSGDVASLNATDRHRVTIVQDWLVDPGFLNGGDTVVFLADSRSLVHPRISRLPQVVSIDVPLPDEASRRHYIATKPNRRDAPAFDADLVAPLTAGLTIHGLRQLLVEARHTRRAIDAAAVGRKVEEALVATLGEDVVEFKRPSHTLKDVVGFTRLKAFLRDELMPRMRGEGAEALSGAAVAGPIGGGKTFIFEAMAAELGLPVLTLKNIRSQWFGQTDVLFERLRAVLASLGRVLIFVDEADTQFGGVGADAHETERRLTGKVQQMMSDPQLRGRVTWLLMTARIQALSPDIRRPGRAGDLILPVLDPEGEDRRDFVRWMADGAVDLGDSPEVWVDRTLAETGDYSAATFASMRSTLRARRRAAGRLLTVDEASMILHDHLPADIGPTRRYQTLQALVNCTRRSLLPDPDVTDAARASWVEELRRLEAAGHR